MNLSILILLPLLTALALMPFRKVQTVRAVALGGALLQFAAAALLLFRFLDARSKGAVAPVIFEEDLIWFAPLDIHYHTGVDGISVAMILLTAFIVLAGVLVSWTVDLWNREFFILLFLLSLGAYGFFIALDLFTLFFFLEMAVIPKFLLIGIWGSGQKTYSAMKLVLMLTGGSALVFVGLAGLYFSTGTFNMLQIAGMQVDKGVQELFFPFLFTGFGFFTAIFPFHTWVPDGHAAAPTAASMFLAGISMKLGGYGCLRVVTLLMPEAAATYSPVIIVLAAIAIIYGAFATMMQEDLKYINAYSSISHCGFVLLGIGMLTQTALEGAVFQMVSHGLMTALFFAAIGMIYTRTHTRLVKGMGGLLKAAPFISSVFVLAGLCSLGLPGLSGFAAEITVFMGSWQRTDALARLATLLACASIVVTAVYILRATGRVIMGPPREGLPAFRDAGWHERGAAGLLAGAIVVLGMAPFLLTKLVQNPVIKVAGAATPQF